MAKPQKLKLQLSALNSLTDQDCAPQLIAALGNRSNLIVAKAAQIAAHNRCHEVIPHLVAAFNRLLLGDPIKNDKGCWAKTAIIKTLFALGYEEEAFYRPILTFRQMEASLPKPEDTASEVRATAVLGFVSSNPWRAVFDLIELLRDPETPVRIAAVQAISALSGDASEALLRQKALGGDREPEVMGECFSALLEIAPNESPQFVAKYLKSRDEVVRELAALALGESRIPEAIQELANCWEETKHRPDSREMVIQALSLSRTDQAFKVLYQIFAEDSEAARSVVQSLAIYRLDERIRSEVESHVKNTGDAVLLHLFAREWAV